MLFWYCTQYSQYRLYCTVSSMLSYPLHYRIYGTVQHIAQALILLWYHAVPVSDWCHYDTVIVNLGAAWFVWRRSGFMRARLRRICGSEQPTVQASTVQTADRLLPNSAVQISSPGDVRHFQSGATVGAEGKRSKRWVCPTTIAQPKQPRCACASAGRQQQADSQCCGRAPPSIDCAVRGQARRASGTLLGMPCGCQNILFSAHA